MFFAHILSLLLVAAGTFQKATGQQRCEGPQYYNRKENDCCYTCPQGYVTRSSCVKDINKECATCFEPKEYIDWSWNPPKCQSCNICRKESDLVEIQSCSLLTEAICQCKPGFYCRTTLHNSCARCKSLKKCPPGQGVKQEGSHDKDTVCETCPSGTFSDVTSAAEACKAHTDCNKLHQVTTRRGSATADAECGGPKVPNLRPSENKTLTNTKYVPTPDTTTTFNTTTPNTKTSVTFTSTTKDGAADQGEWSSVYVVAAILCIISLLIAFLLSWRHKICNLKIWKNFLHPENSAFQQGTVTTNMEENNEENLLGRENTSPESDQWSETTPNEWTTEERLETPQGRDHMGNRIEKIYIMNADTVIVGAISEAPSRFRPLTPESDSQESPSPASRYPEQESSKMSAKDLMFSIEEEERESCAAKAILDV
ncbi:tumor necrosis factor receptor superfamily member 8 isoform X2 [Hyla sarda]|nr:tumor necrosis factor receptor superfamily member 8 isoform X2 [Hyla sarda]XP_056398668.1 tumor necrosis factor receptor superfamily member 8 isoform X2 [Hyla sarda]